MTPKSDKAASGSQTTPVSAEQARDEFSEALDELFTRLEPSTIARYAKDDTRQAANDALDALRGAGLPQSSPRRKRNAIALLTVGAGGMAALGVAILRRAKNG